MSFNKENSPTSKQPNDGDDHLETESIISMLSDTTNGTRTLAFSNLKSRLALLDRDDLGLDEISVDIDGEDNDLDSDDALSLANSISKEMGCTSLSRPTKAPSKINLQIIEPTPPPSTSYIKLTITSSSPLRYYFLKLLQSSINLKTLRINLKCWYCYTKSMCKSRNLGYNCLVFYKRFFIKECFKGLKYYGMLRKWDEVRGEKVKRLGEIKIERMIFTQWLKIYTDVHHKKVITKTMRKWKHSYILSAFKTWKIYCIIVSGWMLHLCFRKWYTLCLQVKTFKAKWLGRKRITLKSKAVKELKDNVKYRKKILSKAGEGFRSYRLRVIRVYFIRYLLTIKALKVKHLISIKVKSRIITNLKVKKDVENIKKKWTKIIGFHKWRALKCFINTVNVFRQFYTRWYIERVLKGWREVCFFWRRVRGFKEGLKGKIYFNVFKEWKEVIIEEIEIRRKFEGALRVRKLKILKSFFSEIKMYGENRRRRKIGKQEGERYWKIHSQTSAIDKLAIWRMRSKTAIQNLKKGEKMFKLNVMLKYFKIFRLRIEEERIRREMIEIGSRMWIEKVKKTFFSRLFKITLIRINCKEGMKVADEFLKVKKIGIGITALYENKERERRVKELREGREGIRERRRRRILEVCFGNWIRFSDKLKASSLVRNLVDKNRVVKTFNSFITVFETVKKERLRLESSGLWRERWALKKCLKKWSSESLRRSAGYQIADRFKAKVYIKRWRNWKDERVKGSTLVWRGERFWERRRELMFFVRVANIVYERKRLDLLLGLWRQRIRVGFCKEIRICFFKWMRYGEERKRRRGRIEGAVEYWRRKVLRGGIDKWRYEVVEFLRFRRNLFKRWRRYVEGVRVKIGVFRKRLKMRRFFVRARGRKVWRRKREEAETWGERRVVGVVFKALVMWREEGKEKVKKQIEMKRALGRKVKIEGLKVVLGEAHWKRKWVKKVWRYWVNWRKYEEEKVMAFLVKQRLKRSFTRWVRVEREGRRERWVGRMVSERRVEEIRREEGGGVGGSASSVVSDITGGSGGGGGGSVGVGTINATPGKVRTNSGASRGDMFSPTMEKGRSYKL